MQSKHLWGSRALIMELARKELKLRYNRSVLGWLWSLLTPAAVLIIYVIVFGIFFRITPPVAGNGTLKSYALFILSGLVAWDLFAFIVVGSMGWLAASRPLIRSVRLAPEVPVIAGALSAVAQAASQLGILVVVMVFLGNISWLVLLTPALLLGVILFALGIGLVLSVLQVQFRDTQHLVNISLTILFFLTPVFYPLTVVPAEIWGGFPIRRLIEANPLTGFVEATRGVLYDLDPPGLAQSGWLLVSTAMSVLIGYTIFSRLQERATEQL